MNYRIIRMIEQLDEAQKHMKMIEESVTNAAAREVKHYEGELPSVYIMTADELSTVQKSIHAIKSQSTYIEGFLDGMDMGYMTRKNADDEDVSDGLDDWVFEP